MYNWNQSNEINMANNATHSKLIALEGNFVNVPNRNQKIPLRCIAASFCAYTKSSILLGVSFK